MDKKILFYGAGKLGKQALEKYQIYPNKGAEVIGFLDTYKQGNYCDYPIYSLMELADKELNIVITLSKAQNIVEINGLLRAKGFQHVYYMCASLKSSRKCENDFLEEYCVKMLEEWVPNQCLSYVETHLADCCNLNCKGCTHFSPLFRNSFPNIDDVISDVKKLLYKCHHIFFFRVLGGEPFLNPMLGEFIVKLRKILPDTIIEIVSNGLLLPKVSDEIYSAIVSNNVQIDITGYPPTYAIINQIEKKMEEQGIAYHIHRVETFGKPLSLNQNSRYQHMCISDGCVIIANGKIACCPTLMYISKFNEKMGSDLPMEGIIELDGQETGEELLRKLKEPVPLCKYCVDNEIEWEQHKGEIKLEDYAVYD